MGKLNALLLAGTVAFGAVCSAHAADLPPAPAFEPIPVEPVDYGGWYLRGDVGVGITSKPEIRSTFSDFVPSPHFDKESLGDTAFVGIGAGYQFNHWLRADVTGEYRTSESLSAIQSYNAGAFFTPPNNSRAFDQYSGNVQSSVFLVNGYIDIGTWYGITPFVGAGVGGSFNRIYGLNDVGVGGPGGFGNGGFGFAPDRSSVALAYAAHAGLSYAVSPNLKLELAYRYLNMGDIQSGQIGCVNTTGCTNEVQKIKLQSNDIKLGMRWMFSDTLPPAPAVYAPPPPVYTPQPPIVRKY